MLRWIFLGVVATACSAVSAPLAAQFRIESVSPLMNQPPASARFLYPDVVVDDGSEAWFVLNGVVYGTDGSASGTRRLFDDARLVGILDGDLIATRDDQDSLSSELLRIGSDGAEVLERGQYVRFGSGVSTPNGLVLVREDFSGSSDSSNAVLVLTTDGTLTPLVEGVGRMLGGSDGVVFFSVRGLGVFATDGTPAGTSAPLSGLGFGDDVLSAHGKLFVTGGFENRVTVIDRFAGYRDFPLPMASPGLWTASADGFFLALEDPVHGDEVFYTDGNSPLVRWTDFAAADAISRTSSGLFTVGSSLFVIAAEAGQPMLYRVNEPLGQLEAMVPVDDPRRVVQLSEQLVIPSGPGFPEAGAPVVSVREAGVPDVLLDAEPGLDGVTVRGVTGDPTRAAMAVRRRSEGTQLMLVGPDGVPEEVLPAGAEPSAEVVALRDGNFVGLGILDHRLGFVRLGIGESPVLLGELADPQGGGRRFFYQLEQRSVLLLPSEPGAPEFLFGDTRLTERLQLSDFEYLGVPLLVRSAAADPFKFFFSTWPVGSVWESDGTLAGPRPRIEPDVNLSIQLDTVGEWVLARGEDAGEPFAEWWRGDEVVDAQALAHDEGRMVGEEWCWQNSDGETVGDVRCVRPGSAGVRVINRPMDFPSLIQREDGAWIYPVGTSLRGSLDAGAGEEFTLADEWCQPGWQATAGSRWFGILGACETDDAPYDPRVNLFVQDGTEDARLVTALFEGSGSAWPLVSGDRVYFAARAQEDAGRELWVSDGTAVGTREVADLWPGPIGSEPQPLIVVDGQLLLSARTPLEGRELWSLDLMTEEFRLVRDFHPGPSGSALHLEYLKDGALWIDAFDGQDRRIYRLVMESDSGNTLDLADSRFQLELDWRPPGGEWGFGTPTSITDDTGAFWFLDEANLEIVAKVLDGTTLNDHHWLFLASLSNVEFLLTVHDRETGLAKRYRSPGGSFASLGDVYALAAERPGADGAISPEEPAQGLVSLRAVPPPEVLVSRVDPLAETGCVATGTRACIDGRYAIELSATVPNEGERVGVVRPLVDDTTSFWLFNENNLEVIVKVLDGSGINGRTWVFGGSLTNLAFELTVTDTQTGVQRIYRNSSGEFASFGDIEAF